MTDKELEQKLIGDAELLALGLNALEKQAKTLGVEINILSYGNWGGHEIQLKRTTVDLDITIGNPNYARKDRTK